eukprot:TRINITY_DN19812_c0_g1_i2.p1 TRINITY_DN19812_c0_g1~~TRINITY_DN19812_c0_g1_i2.p1  ORF type:complete len:378 (-),score=62.08 TRINITY_DN19812_c0_g1_i2:56-1189(-)
MGWGPSRLLLAILFMCALLMVIVGFVRHLPELNPTRVPRIQRPQSRTVGFGAPVEPAQRSTSHKVFGAQALEEIREKSAQLKIRGLQNKSSHKFEVVANISSAEHVLAAGKPESWCKRVNSSRRVHLIQLYHISKCGGTTVNDVFRDAFTAVGKKTLRRESENKCDPGFKCLKPAHVFILGTMRSPFEFYVSYWQMVLKGSLHTGCPNVPGCDPFEYGCVGRAARAVPDVFDTANVKNRTSFGRFLKLVLNLPATGCDFTMNGIYRNLMLPQGGGPPVHDSVVRVEDLYPTLETALKDFECYVPGAVDWTKFEKMRAMKRGNFNQNRLAVPYHCFYDTASAALVAEHDKLILETYNYSFAEFVRRSEGHGDCRNVDT